MAREPNCSGRNEPREQVLSATRITENCDRYDEKADAQNHSSPGARAGFFPFTGEEAEECARHDDGGEEEWPSDGSAEIAEFDRGNTVENDTAEPEKAHAGPYEPVVPSA